MGLRFTVVSSMMIMGWLSLAGASSPAHADFRICNKTTSHASIAIGYKDGDDWVSEGWWNLETGDCAVVVEGDLQNQYYYVRGEADDGHWTDDYKFCYSDEVFTIRGDQDCAARGYKTGGFQEVDVGTHLDFTLDMTE
jgi:uncharacterized membrane protein